ncbi:RDD family protein [Haloarcula sp. S1CR25-12]|uniref:RDD family protein n=1 Tax=Haloarcula saliterrae TaxID=2950534 RepID=A0ABU2FIS1_9EURY|nr:RDD family protein [Haloarcula sp. S1CR25-12]MDS0261676.1 RDD family protein [Haloarcula sp. S1CR25-12]
MAFLVDFTLSSVVAATLWFVFAVIRTLVGVGSSLGAVAADSPGTAAMVGSSLLDLALGFALWLLIALVVGGYFVVQLQLKGQTLGMRLLDLVVVSEDGTAITRQQALERTAVLLAPLPLMALSSVLVPLVGFFIALFLMTVWLLVEAAVLVLDEDAQRLGDRVAGTLVVEESL